MAPRAALNANARIPKSRRRADARTPSESRRRVFFPAVASRRSYVSGATTAVHGERAFENRIDRTYARRIRIRTRRSKTARVAAARPACVENRIGILASTCRQRDRVPSRVYFVITRRIKVYESQRRVNDSAGGYFCDISHPLPPANVNSIFLRFIIPGFSRFSRTIRALVGE